MPGWERRAKVMVGLLEFTLEAFQHGGAGAFYLCATSEAGVGYNAKFEMKLTDASHVLPRHEVQARLRVSVATSPSGTAGLPRTLSLLFYRSGISHF